MKHKIFEELLPSVSPLLKKKKSTQGLDTLVSWTIRSIYQYQIFFLKV